MVMNGNGPTRPRVQLGRSQQGAFSFLGKAQAASAPFSLAEVDAETLHAAITRWTDCGYAITFGRTGDGGAIGVHLLAGGEKRSKYFSTAAECEDFLTSVPGPVGEQST